LARIAIVGVGAIGGVVASLLHLSGRHQIFLCTRRPLSGLTVETPDGPVQVDAQVWSNLDEAQPVDWIMIATKAYDVEGSAAWIAKLWSNGIPVAIIQNGVEHRERFSPYVPIGKIVPVIVDCPAERKTPEIVLQRGPMSLKVPSNSLGSEFVELFCGSPALAETVPDWVTVAWRKLCHNSAGALSALLLRPNEVMHDEAIGQTALEIVRECVAVGRAEGAQLDDTVPEEVLAAYRKAAPNGINSLLADRIAHRPMETEARNGAIVRAGKKHEIPTPCNSMTVALLNALASNNKPIP
jgi:2-dehydropantoate 2-reductase